MMKLIMFAVWALTLIFGIITLGGLGALTQTLGVNGPSGLDLRLVWWYWALEVFALLVCLYALIVNQFSRFRVAICVMMVYTSMGLTPWIQTTLDLSVGGSLQKRVNATCAGILMVTVFNFVITVLSGLYSDDEKSTSSSGTAATAEAKV